MNLMRILAAIAIGIITWAVVYLIGGLLQELDLESIGSAVKGVAFLVGLAAGIYHLATGKTVV